MFGTYTLFLLGATAIAVAIAVFSLSRKGKGPFRALYAALLILSAFLAYIFKLGVTPQLVDTFIPLYKLFDLSQYGYASILEDVCSFGLPFLLFGFFFQSALAGCGLFAAALSGGLLSLALNVYPLFIGHSFNADEYVFAALGSAVGAAMYSIAAWLFKAKAPLENLHLPVPLKRRYNASIALCAVVYLAIAFVMIADHGASYSGIQFFESDTPLPDEMTLECELDSSSSKARIYAPSSQPVAERATAIAAGLGVNGEVTEASGVFTAEGSDSKLTMTANGSWVYEYTGEVEGDIPTRESAIAAVYALFSEHTLLTVEPLDVTDVVERNDSESGALIGYEIYLSTAINGHPIIGSSTLVAYVRAGDTIVKLRRYDGDILTESEKAIISEEKAYVKLKSGDCAYTLFSPAVSATVDSCTLAYMANSSQGYYLPIWVFGCTAANADGTETAFEIYVEALK